MLEWLARILGAVVGWGLFASGCVLWTLVVIPCVLLISPFRPAARDGFLDLTRGALAFYVGMLPFMRVEVRGRRGLRPCLLVANHQSWLDPILMLSLEPRLSGPARRYLFRVPALRSVLRLAGFYPAEVGEPAPLERMRRSGSETRSRGGALLFFPEGTRSKSGEIGPFRRGAFRLAGDAGLPIQPVVIEGLDQVLPPGVWLPRKPWRHPVTVSYLPPLEPEAAEGSRRSAVGALAQHVREGMVEEIARLRAEREASQP